MAKHQSRRSVLSVENLEDRRLAAVDAFIWFETPGGMQEVQGETKDEVYKKSGDSAAFEIKDFSFGVENPTTIGSATGGAGAGKIKFNEFTIKKTTDIASPEFFLGSSTGDDYTPGRNEMRKSGGDPQSAAGDEGPEESITFVYCKIG